MERIAFRGVILDLDGIVTDTAMFHYRAWKEVADDEGIYFDAIINERLKGVSRMDSLRIIMERRTREYSEQELHNIAERKNNLYVSMLAQLTPGDILPGIKGFLDELKKNGIRIAISSASKNTDLILKQLAIADRFDAIVTGNDITCSKPDPEGLLLAAKRLGIPPVQCVVIEDASAGIQAAIAAGMRSVGIGDRRVLAAADCVLANTAQLTLMTLIELLG